MASNESTRRALMNEAAALQEAGKLEHCLTKYDEARRFLDTPVAALRHGHVAQELGLLDAALKSAKEGLALDPENREGQNQWLYCLAGSVELSFHRVHGTKEALERARSYFLDAIRIEEFAGFYIYLGCVHMRLGDGPSAENCLRKALELEPSNEEAMYNLAETIRVSGKGSEDAIALYRKAITIDRRYAAAHRGLAFTLFEAKRYKEAEECARIALKLDGTDWGAHTIMGQILLRKGKIRAARKELERGAELGTLEWDAHSKLASFYDDHGELTDAQHAYRKCLDLDPENAWANRRYGAVLADMEKPIEARTFLKRAIALDPGDRFAPKHLEKLDKMYPHRRTPKRRAQKGNPRG